MNKKFRMRYRHRSWVSKPDLASMGETTLHSDDPGWITDQASKLGGQGHKILAIEKRCDDGDYREISLEQHRERQEIAENERAVEMEESSR